MPTRGGRPSGARAISRPFLRKSLNFFTPQKSIPAWIGHLFKYALLLQLYREKTRETKSFFALFALRKSTVKNITSGSSG